MTKECHFWKFLFPILFWNLFTKDVWRMFTTLVKPPPYAFDFCVLTKPKMVPLLSKRAKPICICLRYFVIAFSRKCLKIFSLFICFRLPQILFLHASLYAKLVFVKDFAVYDFVFKVSDSIWLNILCLRIKKRKT